MLIIKQGFKFLNPFSFGLKDKVMFLVRQCFQVTWPVIIWYTIEMVNYPTFRQWLAMSLFPDKDMFHYISIFTNSRMLRFKYHNVSIVCFNSTALPIRMVATYLVFLRTFLTSFSPNFNRLVAINTRMPMLQPPFLLTSTTHNKYFTIISSNLQVEVLR